MNDPRAYMTGKRWIEAGVSPDPAAVADPATDLKALGLMRIVGGRYRGITLAELGAGDPAAQLRPTSDRVRESLFNLLAHGDYGDPPPPEGRRVLDLFAGTGALGLEALSRGAVAATFVDQGADGAGAPPPQPRPARRRARSARVVTRDATRLGRNPGAAFDLVFLDPPYGRGPRRAGARLGAGRRLGGAGRARRLGGGRQPRRRRPA